MHRLRLLFAAACLTLASGCSKSAAEAAPAPPGDYGGYGGGDAAAAATPLPAEAEYTRDEYVSKKDYDDSSKAAPELSAPAPARSTWIGPTMRRARKIPASTAKMDAAASTMASRCKARYSEA